MRRRRRGPSSSPGDAVAIRQQADGSRQPAEDRRGLGACHAVGAPTPPTLCITDGWASGARERSPRSMAHSHATGRGDLRRPPGPVALTECIRARPPPRRPGSQRPHLTTTSRPSRAGSLLPGHRSGGASTSHGRAPRSKLRPSPCSTSDRAPYACLDIGRASSSVRDRSDVCPRSGRSIGVGLEPALPGDMIHPCHARRGPDPTDHHRAPTAPIHRESPAGMPYIGGAPTPPTHATPNTPAVRPSGRGSFPGVSKPDRNDP